jgi:hypothetical protein
MTTLNQDTIDAALLFMLYTLLIILYERIAKSTFKKEKSIIEGPCLERPKSNYIKQNDLILLSKKEPPSKNISDKFSTT